MMSSKKFGRYVEAEERGERRKRLALRNQVNSEKHLGDSMYGGLGEGIGMKMYLHGPMDFVNTLKLPFRVGDLDLSAQRKEAYQQPRGGGRRCRDVPT